MAHTKASVVFMLVLISFTFAQLDVPKTTTTVTPTDSTTLSTTVPTTSAASTTEASTSSSTTAPPSTATTPSTTIAPTPTAPTTSTTTPRPEPPVPEYKKWSWPTDPNQTCVIIQLAVQLNLTYQTVDDKPSNILYNVPVNDTKVVDGSCEKDIQSITVQWGKSSKMMLTFKVNDTTSQFMLSEIDLSINATAAFSDAKADQIIGLYHKNDEFATPLAMSYHCNKYQPLAFTNSKESTVTVANATISHVQLEAFHKQKSDQFSTARDCEAIDTPDIVPIAVGCALAGLVVVVLIAYLVGRRRAQARGYLSM